MKCPICEGETVVNTTREPEKFRGVVHRYRECLECLTLFKTSEKVLFSSLPKHVRNNFLENGRVK